MTNKEELKDGDWYGASVEVNSDPLVDSGEGDAALYRVFHFKKNPELKEYPSKQELFNIHWPQIQNQLWKDGLVERRDVEPLVRFGDKNDTYAIIVLCMPKFNNSVVEKTATLQDIFKK